VGSWTGKSKGAELEGENKRGGGVTLPHWRGWWGWGSSAVMLLYRTRHLLGLSLAYRVVWAPNGTRLSARCRFKGPKKLSISRAQPPPTCPRNVSACIKNIKRRTLN
jgi:hypothetical protein